MCGTAVPGEGAILARRYGAKRVGAKREGSLDLLWGKTRVGLAFDDADGDGDASRREVRICSVIITDLFDS